MKAIEANILAGISFVLLIGVALMIAGYQFGIVIAALAVIVYVGGWRQIPASPATVGAVTIWGDYLKEASIVRDPVTKQEMVMEKTVALKGDVVILPFYPFMIKIIPVCMTADDWAFDCTIYSIEEVEKDGEVKKVRGLGLKTEIRLTVAPDENHLNSYIKSGGDLKKVRELMTGIAPAIVQGLVEQLNGEDGQPGLSHTELVQSVHFINDELRKRLNGSDDYVGVFQEKSFGVVCLKANVKPEVPESVKKAQENAVSITYETKARAIEYEGDIAAAAKFQRELDVSGAEAWNMAVQSRQMRDGKAQRIQVEGLGNPVGYFPVPHPFAGGNSEKKEKKNKKKKDNP